MEETSLLEQLQAHHASGYLSLHMPGHKENGALAPYLEALGAKLDITELPGFDDLHAPEGILARGMARGAALWGSRKSFYLVNGSTGGLLAGIRAATRRGDQVLVARNCHKAVYHAIELCGLEPVYLLPPMQKEFGLAASLPSEAVAEALEAHPDIKLVVYPSPTYDGVLSDTAEICRQAHSRNVPVLVDEAHGAHLGLHPAFPPSATQGGADLVVASLHKMLPSFTQTAILHTSGRQIPIPQVARQLGIFQSSSPSYLLMASIDGCLGLLEERGEELMEAWAARLKTLDEQTVGLRHLQLMGHGEQAGRHYEGVFALDPAKVIISTRHSDWTGVELRDRLRADYRIEVEMALEDYVVAMTGLGSGDDMPERLSTALTELDRQCGSGEAKAPVEFPPIPQRVCSLEAAASAPSGLQFLYDGMGQICGEYIWAYPPGIPLITPGEIITPEVIRQLDGLQQAGVKLVGTQGKPPFTAAVLTQPPR